MFGFSEDSQNEDDPKEDIAAKVLISDFKLRIEPSLTYDPSTQRVR